MKPEVEWPKLELTLTPMRIGLALAIRTRDAESLLRDGRFIAQIAPYWVCRGYGGIMLGNSRNTYAKTFAFPEGTLKAAVRVMTERVLFHQSSMKGTGRSFDAPAFAKTLREEIELFFVVDARSAESGRFRITVVNSALVLDRLNYYEYDEQGWLADDYYRIAFQKPWQEMDWEKEGGSP